VREIVLGEEVHCETAIIPIGNKTKTIGVPLYAARRSSIEDHDVVPILATAKVRSNDGAARFPKTKRPPKSGSTSDWRLTTRSVQRCARERNLRRRFALNMSMPDGDNVT